MEIRPAKETDAAVVCALWKRLLDFYGKKGDPRVLRRSFRFAVGDPGRIRIYVALCEGSIVGTASLHLGHYSTWNDNWYGHIEDLIVHPAHRRRGAARKLLRYILAAAAAEGLSRLELNVLADNQAARRIYEALGFKTDSVVYERPVTAGDMHARKERFTVRDYREIPLWKETTGEEWGDWRWQVANRITSLDELRQVIQLSDGEAAGVAQCLQTLRMAVTPYYATLIDPFDQNCPIRRQAVPTGLELHRAGSDLEDPLYEDADSPVPGLTHRYPDRVLLLLTDQCSMYCRHCTRRRLAGVTDRPRSREEIDGAVDYVRRTPAVRDVLLSGGDGLLLDDEIIESVLRQLKDIPHVEIIRFGTRTPVVLPQRITPELCRMLSRYHPIYVNTHFNHPLPPQRGRERVGGLEVSLWH